MEASCNGEPSVILRPQGPELEGESRHEEDIARVKRALSPHGPAPTPHGVNRLTAKHPLAPVRSPWDSPAPDYRSGDQCPVVARFLASLPSPRYQSTWSLPSIHSVTADVCSDVLSDDADSTQVCGPAAAIATHSLSFNQRRDADDFEDSCSTASDEAESACHEPRATPRGYLPSHGTPLQQGAWGVFLSTPPTAESATGPVRYHPVFRRPISNYDNCNGGAAAELGTSPGNAEAAAAGANGQLSKRGLFVGNLPGGVTERQLMHLFSRCGPIVSCWIARDARNQAPLGYGYVVYDAAADPQAHLRALNTLDGSMVLHQPITVRLSSRSFEDKAAPSAAGAAAPGAGDVGQPS